MYFQHLSQRKDSYFMNEILKNASNILNSGNYSLVIINNGTVYKSRENGVKPLLDLLNNDKLILKNSSAADKVIGKAAALLMLYGGIKELCCNTISVHAAEILEKNNFSYYYNTKVDFIQNRSKNGMCPMEKLCLDIENPSEAFQAINNKVNSMN